MDAVAAPPLNWKQRLARRSTWTAIGSGLALGAALGAAYWKIVLVPDQARVNKRVQSTLDIAKLFADQLSYKRAKGVYANDFAALLSVDPDGAALKANLAANVDMTTLTVVGSADKFKIELNVLDPDRTPIKVKGPIAPKAAPAPAAILPVAPPPMNADGSPIAPPPGR